MDTTTWQIGYHLRDAGGWLERVHLATTLDRTTFPTGRLIRGFAPSCRTVAQRQTERPS